MKRVTTCLAVLTLVAAACSPNGQTGDTQAVAATAPTTEATTTTSPAPSAVDDVAGKALTVVESEFGRILADADGNTLYIFMKDNQSDSTCYGGCEENWPAFYAPVDPDTGVDGSLIGETDRTDDTKQITYDGWPLYYFAADTNPGDTNGQGVGDVWYVINPDGGVMNG